jgi:hypothetical protein
MRVIDDLPAVEDVHEGDGKNIGLLGPGEVGDVSVEGNALQSAVSKKAYSH